MIEQFKDYLEVDAAEYRSFVKELKPNFFHKEEEVFNTGKAYYIINNDDDKLICGNSYNNKTGEVKYYIVNMPNNEARLAPRSVRKIVLETEEEVKAFFDIINKTAKQKEEQ